MKKKIKILTYLMICLICFMNMACRPLVEIYHPPKVEWDGRFLYYYVYNNGLTPYYRILGTEPTLGAKSEVIEKLYIPSHYKGIMVCDFICKFGGYDEELEKVVSYTFGLDITPVKELYCPYYMGSDEFLGEHNYYKIVMTMIERANYCVFVDTTVETTAYIPSVCFDHSLKRAKKSSETQVKWEKNYAFCCYSEFIGENRYIYKANTAYMFNYEGAPNEGYYFINDFERGGLVENTPYKPIREGYEFCGWYKESECKTKWDFNTDVLPEPTYGENGELEYVETKLYAKWRKI